MILYKYLQEELGLIFEDRHPGDKRHKWLSLYPYAICPWKGISEGLKEGDSDYQGLKEMGCYRCDGKNIDCLADKGMFIE